MKCRNNSFFSFIHSFGKKSSSGFSLVSVLVGVGILGISAVVVSETVINSRRAQKLVDLKLSANKFQQAILDSVTERVKEFVIYKNCSGTTWGGSGTTEVEKAFSQIDVIADGSVGLELNLTKSASQLPGNTDVKTRCERPVGPASLNAGQYMRFCMEIKPTAATSKLKYGFSEMDYRLLEVLVVPVELATDKAITCAQARGAATGFKVAWQIFNVLNNSRINSADTSNKTVTRESGVFLASSETESYASTCNVTASRIGSTDQCKINVSGLGIQPPTLFNKVNGNRFIVTGFDWGRDVADPYKFSATVPCDGDLPSEFRVQSAEGSDFCDAAIVPDLLPPTCTLTVNRIESSNWCTIASSGLGRSTPVLKKDLVVLGGLAWSRSGYDTYSTRTSCANSANTRFDTTSTKAGVNRACKQGIKKWYLEIGDGHPDFFARTAIPGQPLLPTVVCEGASWQQIAKANGYAAYEYGGAWVWQYMCRENASEKRYNYTSCGDNNHVAWNGTRWASVPACSDSWSVYLRMINPSPANYVPVP